MRSGKGLRQGGGGVYGKEEKGREFTGKGRRRLKGRLRGQDQRDPWSKFSLFTSTIKIEMTQKAFHSDQLDSDPTIYFPWQLQSR